MRARLFALPHKVGSDPDVGNGQVRHKVPSTGVSALGKLGFKRPLQLLNRCWESREASQSRAIRCTKKPC